MRLAPLLFAAFFALAPAAAFAQQTPPTPPPPSQDDAGPITTQDGIIIPKKKEAPEPAPAAPEQPKVKNPNGETYSLRVDVPIVNLDVSTSFWTRHTSSSRA